MLRTAHTVFSRPLVITLVSVWVALAVAAFVYGQAHPQNGWLTAALPACLLEASFYVAATFGDVRAWLARTFPPVGQATLLALSGILPYFAYAAVGDTFQLRAFLLLTALVTLLSFWYPLTPRRIAYDLGFVVIAATPIVVRVFKRIYHSPDAHLPMDTLGHLMWIRLGMLALLVVRGWDPGRFSLWPEGREWRLGALYYSILLLPLCAVALALGDVQFEPLHKSPLVVAEVGFGTFFGILWVVALSEELFFRGFIACALLKGGYSPLVAVLVSALLFGSVHLWVHEFPNWRRAVVAAVLGLGCGLAYVRTKSVRAPMVTHALVVTTWRLFFK